MNGFEMFLSVCSVLFYTALALFGAIIVMLVDIKRRVKEKAIT
jgi:hypothetical protein